MSIDTKYIVGQNYVSVRNLLFLFKIKEINLVYYYTHKSMQCKLLLLLFIYKMRNYITLKNAMLDCKKYVLF